MSLFLIIDGASKGKILEVDYNHPHQDHLIFHDGKGDNYKLYPFTSSDGRTYLIGSLTEYNDHFIEEIIKSSEHQSISTK